jgi:hypothetical protein
MMFTVRSFPAYYSAWMVPSARQMARRNRDLPRAKHLSPMWGHDRAGPALPFSNINLETAFGVHPDVKRPFRTDKCPP